MGIEREGARTQDMDNSLVIMGRREYRGLNGNGKNTIKKFLKSLWSKKGT